jgi:tyrosine-protein phosphatase SIW14
MPNDSSADSSAVGQPQATTSTGPDAPGAWSWRRFVRNAALVAAIAFLAGLFVVQGVIPNLVPKNFGVVEEGVLYRSGELTTAALAAVVEDHAIRTVIDFGAHDNDPDDERREQRTAEVLGVERHVLNLYGDATGDPNRYAEALRLMTDPDAQPVLVHCAAGAQRTGCAVALYRSLVQGWDDDRALAEAGDYRHDPEDNPRLPAMYHAWREEIGRAFREGGTIEYDPDRPFDTAPADGAGG